MSLLTFHPSILVDCQDRYADEYATYHVWRRPENSSNIIIKESGHLVVQIAPEVLGRWIPSVECAH